MLARRFDVETVPEFLQAEMRELNTMMAIESELKDCIETESETMPPDVLQRMQVRFLENSERLVARFDLLLSIINDMPD